MLTFFSTHTHTHTHTQEEEEDEEERNWAIFLLMSYLLSIDLVSVCLKHVAYEYAKRGARLVLVARREDRLRAVANKAVR